MMRTFLAAMLCVCIMTGNGVRLAGGDVSAADPTVLPYLKPVITHSLLVHGVSCPQAFIPDVPIMFC